VFGGC